MYGRLFVLSFLPSTPIQKLCRLAIRRETKGVNRYLCNCHTIRRRPKGKFFVSASCHVLISLKLQLSTSLFSHTPDSHKMNMDILPPFSSPAPTPPSTIKSTLRIKPWLLPPPRPTLLRNLRLIDPLNSRIIPNAIVAIKDGVVAYSGSMYTPQFSKILGTMSGNVDIADMQQSFVCPGLIDCHVHVTAVPGVKTMADAVSESVY